MAESPYNPPTAQIDPPIQPEQQAMERPREIIYAIGLVVLMYVLGWVGILLSWDYQMSLQSTGQFLIGQVLGIAIAGWIYYKVYQGRNWARILILVFSVFGWLMLLVPTVNQVLASAPTISQVVTISSHLIQLAVLWFLFISPGRHWFKNGIKNEVA